MKRLAAVLVLVVFHGSIPFAGSAFADPLDDANAAFRQGDYAAASRILKAPAEQGDAAAQNLLGTMYAIGVDGRQDFAEAANWFRRAAEQGNADAQYNLAMRYVEGQGVSQDYVQAHMWYSLAASGFQDARSREDAARSRDLVASRMTPAQIVEAKRLAGEWKAKPKR